MVTLNKVLYLLKREPTKSGGIFSIGGELLHDDQSRHLQQMPN